MKNYTTLIVLTLLISVPSFAQADSFFSSIFSSKTETKMAPPAKTPPTNPQETSSAEPSSTQPPKVTQETASSVSNTKENIRTRKQEIEAELLTLRKKLHKELEPEWQKLRKKIQEQQQETETKLRAMREKIYKDTGGTPFFILEVVKLLIEDKALKQKWE